MRPTAISIASRSVPLAYALRAPWPSPFGLRPAASQAPRLRGPPPRSFGLRPAAAFGLGNVCPDVCPEVGVILYPTSGPFPKIAFSLNLKAGGLFPNSGLRPARRFAPYLLWPPRQDGVPGRRITLGSLRPPPPGFINYDPIEDSDSDSDSDSVR